MFERFGPKSARAFCWHRRPGNSWGRSVEARVGLVCRVARLSCRPAGCLPRRRDGADGRPGSPSAGTAPCPWPGRSAAGGSMKSLRRRALGEEVVGDRVDLGVVLGPIFLGAVVGQPVEPRHPRIGPERVRVGDPLDAPTPSRPWPRCARGWARPGARRKGPGRSSPRRRSRGSRCSQTWRSADIRPAAWPLAGYR